MAGDNHGDKTQEEPQAQENLGQQQTQEEQPQVSSVDWEKAIAERDWLLQDNLDTVPWRWTPFREEADTIPRESDTVSKERSPMMKRIPLHISNPLVVGAGAHSGRQQPQIMRYVPGFPSANASGWAIGRTVTSSS